MTAKTLAPLWTHQREDLPRLLELLDTKGGALVEYAMGGGKSRLAIEVIRHYNPKRVLVIASKTAAESAWDEQCALWLSDRYSKVNLAGMTGGAKRAEVLERALATQPALVAIANYECYISPRAVMAIESATWDLLVLDESHHVKDPNGAQAKRIYSGVQQGIYKRRLALTGTPIPHSPADLFMQYKILNAGVFGKSYPSFKHTFFIEKSLPSNPKIKIPVKFINQERFAELKNELAIVRSFAECCADVPPLTQKRLKVKFSEPAADVMRQLDAYSVAEVKVPKRNAQGGRILCENVLTVRLRQLMLSSGIGVLQNPQSNDTRDVFVDFSKLAYLKYMLQQKRLRSERIVIFAKWRRDLEEIEKLAKYLNRPLSVIKGGITRSRKEIIDEWRLTDNGIMLGQAGAIAEGVNLTAARIAISYSRGYSYGELAQCVHRFYRPGQTRRTYFYYLVTDTDIEGAQMKSMIARKMTLKELNEIYLRLKGGK